ncbi:MAG: hypothetical protein V9E88_03325 [Ferruginibacter sp.]
MRTRLDVSGIPYAADFGTLATLIRDLNYSRLPVYRSNLDEIAGMIHTKDLLPYLNEAPGFRLAYTHPYTLFCT